MRPIVVSMAISALWASAASAATLPMESASYSATATYDIDNNHYTSSVVADHGRERHVVQTPYGQQTIFISLAEGKAYLLQPPIGAFAMDLSSPEAGVALAVLYGAPAEPMSQETIDGMRVTKYRIATEPAANTRFDGFVWSTDDGIYVRVEGTGTHRGVSSHVARRLTGVRRAAQDPGSVTLPPGTPVLDANPIVKQFLQQGLQ